MPVETNLIFAATQVVMSSERALCRRMASIGDRVRSCIEPCGSFVPTRR